jgi:hypothetical protein
MAQESLTQVTGSFLESSTAKMDAPAVCTQKRITKMMMMIGRGSLLRRLELQWSGDDCTSQRRSTLLSAAFARASAIGLPSPAS